MQHTQTEDGFSSGAAALSLTQIARKVESENATDYFNPSDVVAILGHDNPEFPYRIILRNESAFETSELVAEATLAAIEHQDSQAERIVAALEAIAAAIRFGG